MSFGGRWVQKLWVMAAGSHQPYWWHRQWLRKFWVQLQLPSLLEFHPAMIELLWSHFLNIFVEDKQLKVELILYALTKMRQGLYLKPFAGRKHPAQELALHHHHIEGDGYLWPSCLCEHRFSWICHLWHWNYSCPSVVSDSGWTQLYRQNCPAAGLYAE